MNISLIDANNIESLDLHLKRELTDVQKRLVEIIIDLRDDLEETKGDPVELERENEHIYGDGYSNGEKDGIQMAIVIADKSVSLEEALTELRHEL